MWSQMDNNVIRMAKLHAAKRLQHLQKILPAKKKKKKKVHQSFVGEISLDLNSFP